MQSHGPALIGTGVDARSGRKREQTFSFSALEPSDERPEGTLLRRLNESGIAIPPNSRFARYFALAASHKASLAMRQLALLEISQLATAARSIPDIGEWKEKFAEALRYDMDIPGKPGATSRGRDSQFELYVGGRLCELGASIRLAEPDLLCEWKGHEFGIAAKRLKSRKQLLKRTKEARNQIQSSKQMGIICLDFTPVFQSAHTGTLQIEVDLFPRFAMGFLDKEFEENLLEIQESIKSELVLGVIAFADVGAFSGDFSNFMQASIHNGHCTVPTDEAKANLMWELIDKLGHPMSPPKAA